LGFFFLLAGGKGVFIFSLDTVRHTGNLTNPKSLIDYLCSRKEAKVVSGLRGTEMTAVTLVQGTERKNYFRSGDRTYRVSYKLDRTDGNSRVFVDFKETVMENLMNRRSRDWRWMKPIVEKALADNGINFEKISWNRYAGCQMCPCSGGFVVSGGDIGKDYWLTITEGGE
jgi:hypothetical protein